MHYLAHIFHRIKKHKFSVMCPDALLVESAPHLSMKNSAIMFHAPDALDRTI
jgi:hypothetical protein